MTAVTQSPPVKTNPHLFVVDGELPAAPGLRGAHCNSCGKATLGRVPVCCHCFSTEVEARALGQKAEMIEFSIAHVSAGGFEAPYAIAQICTDEGLILFAPLLGDTEGLVRGQRLEFQLASLPSGAVGFGYARPTAQDASR